MKTIGKVPVEILVDAVDCLISIARNQVLRDIIINTDIIEAMCASFEVYFLFNFLNFYQQQSNYKFSNEKRIRLI